jgi:quercetin dioxygenase-like cupin family protein
MQRSEQRTTTQGERGLVVDPGRRQRYRFRTTGTETDGARLEAEVWVDPGGDVPRHVHPRQEERFQVLAGDVRFQIGRNDRRASAGDAITVPAGVPHAFVNDGGGEAHLLVEVRPALDLQEFLETTAWLGRAGKMTPGGRPRGPRALLELALLAEHFRGCTHLARPPLLVQRIGTAPLAALARLLGYHAEALIAAAKRSDLKR